MSQLSDTSERGDQMLFWGCFVALITTSFAFMGRVFLIEVWKADFGLDNAEGGRLLGIGIWPFAVSIIFFSLVIDRIGYKTAMVVAFVGHLVWTVMAVSAYFVREDNPELGFQLLYWGSLICALANGTVEAFINPVVATMFSRQKTKWLNILHAGWPAGLVITGLLIIGIDAFDVAREAPQDELTPWAVKVGLIGLPAVIYFLMLVGLKFPKSERVSAGVSYREMLREFGVAGAAIVGVLLVLQLMDFFSGSGAVELTPATKGVFIAIGVGLVASFGLYTRSVGRPLLFILILIMMPLATTEIGTDGWITGIMEGMGKQEGFHPGWVLVYTSAIMLILRFFAGPIVHKLSPLGLLAISALLAILGLVYLSQAAGMAIFLAATLYGFGKTFFWPTMLGVVSEQCPKGGALTLNAISGIGMLAVGTLGTPFIGSLQEKVQQQAILENSDLQQSIPGLVKDGKVQPVKEKSVYEFISYQTIDNDSVSKLIDALPADAQQPAQQQLKDTQEQSRKLALRDMAVFPIFMLVAYLALIFYFRSQGGYEAEVLTGHAADDEKFTGGVEGPMEG